MSTIAVVATAVLMGCSSEIPESDKSYFDGLATPPSLDDSATIMKKEYTLNHPCMLHTQADIDRVKGNLTKSPWKEAYAYLESSWLANPSKADETSRMKDGLLKRMDAKNWSGKYSDYNNYTGAMRDAAAAYSLALRYQLSGDTQYADAAVRLLNAWATNCKGILKMKGYTNDIPDPNMYLLSIQVYQWANAAELVRNYAGWQKDDFKKFQNWMLSTYYEPLVKPFLTNHNGGQGNMHYWLNWDLAQLTALLSMGILTDNQYMVNWAIYYFKNEDGLYNEAGNIKNAVPFIHDDPDSEEQLGQCEESGRDQGHATLCVSLMGAFCQMAYNIGEDLFAYDDYRALKMAEYVGKYNLIKDEAWAEGNAFQYESSKMPYTSYSNPSYTNPTVSEAQRGAKRPSWELFYGYAKQHNVPAKYCGEWVRQMRELNSFKCDGGSGTYDSNSGGYDQLGYGTLMFAVE